MNNLLDLPKTLYFNFHYLGFKGLLKLPILVSRKVKLSKTNGNVALDSVFKFGMIKIGFPIVGIFDYRYDRSIWEVSGDIIFKGKAVIGSGTKISVSEKGKLIFGNNFNVTSSSALVCDNIISFGSDCLLSWDILIIDTDYHKIKYKDAESAEVGKEIFIGSKVWIGCRSVLLKGTSVGNNCVIGASSLLNKKYPLNNKLIAGNPAKAIKDIDGWEM